ncbi:MAG: alpha/beta fold hydrolase [Nanoarchaeota archaeon]
MKYQYRHLEPVKDDILRAYIDKDGYPVMMAGGLYSNIDTWDEFGRELANEGFEIYLVELTGGPFSEADDAYNYPYEHLVDNVIPEYVNFVLDDSGQSKIKYVGHSNGCRSALSSINKHSSLSSSPMSKFDTFIGVACPINLNQDTTYTDTARYDLPFTDEPLGPLVLSSFNDKHLTQSDFNIKAESLILLDLTNPLNIAKKSSAIRGIIILNSFMSNEKISYNLFNYYINLAVEEDSQMDVSNLNVDNLVLINGAPSDFIVPIEDQEYVLDNIDLENSKGHDYISFIGFTDHSNIISWSRNEIKEELK